MLSVGWLPTGLAEDEWLRKGDYFTDTIHPVDLDEAKDSYQVDIHVVCYQ